MVPSSEFPLTQTSAVFSSALRSARGSAVFRVYAKRRNMFSSLSPIHVCGSLTRLPGYVILSFGRDYNPSRSRIDPAQITTSAGHYPAGVARPCALLQRGRCDLLNQVEVGDPPCRRRPITRPGRHYHSSTSPALDGRAKRRLRTIRPYGRVGRITNLARTPPDTTMGFEITLPPTRICQLGVFARATT